MGLGGDHARVELVCPGGMTWEEWCREVPHCHLHVGRDGGTTRLLNRPSWLLDSGCTVTWLLSHMYSDIAWLTHVEHVLQGDLEALSAVVVLSAPLQRVVSFIACNSFAIALWCNVRMVKDLLEALP